jgi:hypothetical protein
MEAKETSSKYKKFLSRQGSTDVFELEAVDPFKMQHATAEAIEGNIDLTRFNEELAAEKNESTRLAAMKKLTTEAFSGMSENRN